MSDQEREGFELQPDNAGFLNDFGGGDVGRRQDYFRAELDRAQHFYAHQVEQSRAQAQVPDGWCLVPEDLQTHMRDWTNACFDALRLAKSEHRGDDEKYWRRQLRALDNIQAMLQSAPQQPADQSFQRRVGSWMLTCFGPEIAADKVERNHRFFEEATELVQACGMTASECHQLVDYTYGRPVGEKGQEVGGVKVVLAALCNAHGIDTDAEAEKELARINQPETVKKIREKQAAKPKHSPLPESPDRLQKSECDCCGYPGHDLAKWREILRESVPQSKVLDHWEQAISQEDEFPDEMPDDIWNAIKRTARADDRTMLTECFRMTVRLTKDGIRDRMKAMLAGDSAAQDDKSLPAPTECRNQLQRAGKAYPRSTCAICGPVIGNGYKGCPYEQTPSNPPRRK